MSHRLCSPALALPVLALLLCACAGESVDVTGSIRGGPSEVTVIFEEEHDDGQLEEIDCITLEPGVFEETVIVSDTPTVIWLSASSGDLEDGCDGDEYTGTASGTVDEEGQIAPVALELGPACTPSTGELFDNIKNIGCALAPSSLARSTMDGLEWFALVAVALCLRRRRDP